MTTVIDLTGMSAVGYIRVPLRARDGKTVAYAIIDEADAADILQHRWYLASRGYAVRQYRDPSDPVGKRRCRCEFMHRRILGLTTGDRSEADHVNRDKLDNRRSNLRKVTHGENEQNKVGVRSASGYRNVSYSVGRGFFARVVVNRRQHVRGYWPDPETASNAADLLRAELHAFRAHP